MTALPTDDRADFDTVAALAPFRDRALNVSVIGQPGAVSMQPHEIPDHVAFNSPPPDAGISMSGLERAKGILSLSDMLGGPMIDAVTSAPAEQPAPPVVAQRNRYEGPS